MIGRNTVQEQSDREYRPRNPWSIPFGLLIIFGVICLLCVRFNLGEIDRVKFMAFSPDQKIEYLVRQADLIKKSDQGINFFREKVARIDERYKSYGEDKNSWPDDVKLLYDEDRRPAQFNLEKAINERNELAKIYKLNFSKLKKDVIIQKDTNKKLPDHFEEIVY